MIKLIQLGSSHILFWSILVFAIAINSIRFGMTQLDTFKPDLESKLSELIGSPVTIEKIRGSLTILNPEISLHQIRIHSKNSTHPALQLREIALEFDLLTALRSTPIEALQISLIGTKLSVKRLKSGGIAIHGLPHKDDEQHPTWLMQGKHYKLIDSEINWQDENRNATPILLKHVNIAIFNNSTEHKIFIGMDLPKSLGKSLNLSMQFKGDIFTPKSIEANLYVQGKNINLSKVITGDLPFELSIPEGRGDFSIWSTWHQAKMTEMSGSINLDKTTLSSASAYKFPVKQLDVLFKLQKQQQQWQLAIERSDINSNDINLSISQLALALEHNANGELSHIALNCPQLNLGHLTKIISSNKVLPPLLQESLLTLDPEAEIQDLLFIAKPTEQSFAVTGQLNNIKFKASETAPGLENLSLYVQGSHEQGEVYLSSQQLSFNAPSVFRSPLHFNHALGKLHWQQTADSWLLSSPLFELKSAHIALQNKFQLSFSKSERPVHMSLQSSFDIYDATKTPDYLPAGILEENLVNWLDNAFLAGNVNQGGILVHGALVDYPFTNQEGAFEVLFNAENVNLRFAPDWPSIQNAEAEVHFFAESFEANIHKGQSHQANINHAYVTIDSFTSSEFLNVQGAITGELAQATRYFKSSPFTKEATSVSELLELEGLFNLNLGLKVPLGDQPLKLDTTLVTQGAKANVIPANINISNINSEFHISETEVLSTAFSGQTLGFPISAQISSHSETTHAAILGYTDITHLSQQFPNVMWQHFSGASEYQIELDIPKTIPFKSNVELRSTLTGIDVDFPPFSKTAEQSYPFTLKLNIAHTGLGSFAASYENLDSPNNRLAINLKKINPHWQGLIHSPIASGSLFIPVEFNSKAKLSLLLNKLDLSELQKIKFKGAETDTPFTIKNFPHLNLQSNTLFWQGTNLGKLQLMTQPSIDGLAIKKLDISTETDQLSATGNWRQLNDANSTSLQGSLLSEDFGELLERYHLSKNIKKTTAEIPFSLTWAAEPYAVSSSNVSGVLHPYLTKGRILGVDPGIGRVLGAFDIWKLGRRLRLDFTDITTEGLSFSEVSADISLTKGQVSSNNSFIDSMPAKIYLSGTTQLANKEIDLSATVLPKFPIAGTIIGNFANTVSKTLTGNEYAGGLLVSLVYKITGTWEDFSVEREFAQPLAEETP